ncbi:MAG: discoidin domain-containing protein [Candidatus Theseobacter exili]|nr:discoidin domain-containing protein [Candidatus Theseobacter exili]
MKGTIQTLIISFVIVFGVIQTVTAETQYIRNWLLCGPFKGESLLSETIPNEAATAPKEGDFCGGKMWKEYNFIQDKLDLEEETAFNYVDRCVGYAFVKINSPKEQYTQLRLGSDDGIRVWLNGIEIIAHDVKRALNKDEDRVMIVLKKGENNLLVKVSDFYAGYGFAARICNPDGSEIEGLKFIPEKSSIERIPVKHVLVSSVQGDDIDGFDPTFAVDDDMKTRWSSNHYDPQWIRLNFSGEHILKRIDLFWENAYPKEYSIEVSPDGKNWNKVYKTKNGSPGHKILLLNPPVKADYVRMFGAQKATPWGNSLWEFAAFGVPSSGTEKVAYKEALKTVTGDIIKPMPVELAVASSEQPDFVDKEKEKKETYGPMNAVDNDLQTRWSSMHEDPQWISLDLGAKKEIDEIHVVWETAHASEYKIEISDDNVIWTEVYLTNDSDGLMDIIIFENPINARYVKLTGLRRATDWGYSIWEIKVF